MIRCPFCYWSRLPDSSKGAPPFDHEKALDDLMEHLNNYHRDLKLELKLALAKHGT